MGPGCQPGQTLLPPRSPASSHWQCKSRAGWGPQRSRLCIPGTRTRSVVAVSLSLETEKPVAHEKAHPPEGFRQGSFSGLKCPTGSGGLAGPCCSRTCRAAASWALQTAAFIVFHEDCTYCHDFPNTRPFQTREPDPLRDLGSNITGMSCFK